MRKLTKVVVWCMVLVMIAGTGALSCAQPEPTPPPEPEVLVPEGELSFAVGLISESFDPMVTPGYAKIHLDVMYDFLVGCSLTESKVDPDRGIAYKWDVSPDEKTFTFYIREGVKFSNGDDLTAEDVKFSIERLTSKQAVSAEAKALAGVIDSIEVLDPYKVRITTKKPCFWLIPYLSQIVGLEGMVLPKKYIEQVGDKEFAVHPIGSGPYKLADFVSGSYILYEAREGEHWRVGVPKYKTLRYITVPEENVRQAMLQKDEVDIIGVELMAVEPMKEKGFPIYEKPGARTCSLWFGSAYREDSPFYKEKVREAMNLAIDWDSIQKYIFKGTGKRTSIYPVFGYSAGAIDLPLYPYDPTRAKQLLAEAGYPNGFEINLHDVTGYTTEYHDLNTTVASNWEDIGLKVNIIPTEYLTYRAKQKSHELDPTDMLGVLGIPCRLLAHGTIHALYHSKGAITQFAIPEFDALVDELLAAQTEADYDAEMAKVLTYMHEHYMTLPFGETSMYLCTQPEITDWKFTYNMGDYNVEYLFTRESNR